MFLAAVIVLTSTPAMLAGSLGDPTDPIARMGSQLRRLAAAVPVRLVSRAPKRDQHRPVADLSSRAPVPGAMPVSPAVIWAVSQFYVTLAPGAEAVASVEAVAEPRYCKFDVQDWRANFRASVLVREEGLGTISALSAQ